MPAVEDQVRRNRADGSREYVDPADPSKVYPSVTTVISAATAKPWLVSWAGKLAAEFAVDQIATVRTVLETSGREAAVGLVKDAARRQRDERADIGTFLHDVVEVCVKGGPMPLVPDELQPYVDAFVEWWVAFDPTPLATELTVCSTRHIYAGTVDLIVELWVGGRRITAVIDVKTGANIDAEMAAQLAAYRRADQVWLPLGEKAPMPECEAAFVLHLRPEGYRMLPVDTDGRAFAAFLRMLELWHWKDEKADRLVGLPVLPPNPDGTPRHRPIEHVVSDALGVALIEAGYSTCEALEQVTAAQLLKIKGIGPKKIELIVAGLAEVGLKLAGAV